MTERMKKIRGKIITGVLVGVMLIGFSLVLYPTAANWWNQKHQTTIIKNYDEIINKLTNEEYLKILDDAEQYNLAWSKKDTFNTFLTDEERAVYEKVFSKIESDAMGYITVPAINVNLAVYQGTDDAVLRVGIGHIDWSALPVGGAGTHCVLSGHSGMPSARLLTDLPKLVVGDAFTLNILSEIYTYEVDQIRIVLPHETEALLPAAGRDLCTLMTCTPYGVNSHRLLVRGHRVENANALNGRVQANAMRISQLVVAVFIGFPIMLLIFIGALIFMRPKKDMKRITSHHITERN